MLEYWIIKTKNFVLRKKVQADLPRKKVELQLYKINQQLEKQVQILKTVVANPNISDIATLYATDLLKRASTFQELDVVPNSRAKLATSPTQLIDPNSFSIWVNLHAKYLVEEIYYFLGGIQGGD